MSGAASTLNRAVPQYRVLCEGSVFATLAGTDREEGYVEADVCVQRKGRNGLSISIERVFTGWQSQYSSNARSFRGERDKTPAGDLFCLKFIRPIVMGECRTENYSTEMTQKIYVLTFSKSRYATKQNGLQG